MSHAKRFRYQLKHMLSPIAVPILAGPLKGSRIGLFTGARFIRGTYSQDETAIFERLVNAGDVVFDIGAHVGYFTLLASRLVGADGKVFAFEPLPVNLAYLNQHKRVNRATNVQILPVAVGGSEGEMSMDMRSGTGRGRLDSEIAGGGPRVKVVNLDALVDRGDLPGPDFIKMDVEGAEGEALRGAAGLLVRHRPTILLSLHGQEARDECEAFLKGLGFDVSYLKKSLVVAEPKREPASLTN